MLKIGDWGPVEILHATIRRRVPQAAASIQSGEDGRYVRVTYRDVGPRTADWDGSAYRWRTAEGPYQQLPADPEMAAECIARGLGLLPRSPGAPDGRP